MEQPIIKTIVVEDVKSNRETLIQLLSKKSDFIEVVAEAENIEEGYDAIIRNKPDLVFLDIQLDRGTSFDLLEKLFEEDAIHFEIIFVTGHGNYENITRAIEFSALDFVSKPIDEEKLFKAIDKAMKRIDGRQYNKQIELLLDLLQKPQSPQQRIAFHLLKGIVELVQVDDILYLEADGVLTYVHLKNNTKLTATKNLGHYSKLLTAGFHFYQISSSIVINMSYVQSYDHTQLQVNMSDGRKVSASRRGGQDFKRYLASSKEYEGMDQEVLKSGLLAKLFKMF